jgi:hypothetical protein
MRRKTRIAWLFTLKSAWIADRKLPNIVEASTAKIASAEAAQDVAALGERAGFTRARTVKGGEYKAGAAVAVGAADAARAAFEFHRFAEPLALVAVQSHLAALQLSLPQGLHGEDLLYA